jgi:parvulin-like peptidyl-prolyl isomerase
LGWHILNRVPLAEVDAALAESNFVRLRGILIQFDTARGADPATAAVQSEAKRVADGIHRRLLANEDMRALAGEFDQDPGGRERQGDLGWLYRYAPNLPDALRRVFLMRPGDTTEPLLTPVGYLIVRRER